MQIVIPTKPKKILLLLGIVAVLSIVLLALHPLWFPSTPTPIPGLSPDEQAAVNAVTAFYTLDFNVDPDLWAVQVCALSTEIGCQAIREFFAPTVQTVVLDNRVQTGCVVTPIRLVAINEDSRIWQLHVVLDHPWPNLENPSEQVFVEVAEVNNTWLMNRILFEQEAEYLPTSIP